MAVTRMIVLVALLAASPAGAAELGSHANPIRKVVTMLQNMQKQIEAESEKEEALFERYMCYCKTSGGTLSEGIEAAKAKIPQLESKLGEAAAKKIQLEEDLKTHKADREAAKKAMAEATALRKKEAAAFEKETSEDKANLAALEKALTAIETGMGGSFLQTSAGMALQRLLQTRQNMLEADREEVLSFLSGSQGTGYAPQAGEIVGILKQMGDEMTADLKDVTAVEEAAIKSYDELMAAKTKEVAACTKNIQDKLERVAALGVENAEMANDLEDTKESLAEDEKFLADMEKNCKTKEAEWAEIKKNRAEEVVALADTIRILNDDSALDLFKKTLPSASASFVQMQVSTTNMRARALNILTAHPHQGIDFIALALRGKKIGFESVIKMIDELAVTLKQEQVDDDAKLVYCNKEFDESDDKKKGLERSVEDLGTAIADSEEGIATLKDEIAALEAGIIALDKAVAEATEQRKEEHDDFVSLMASDSAAKELLNFAKNRLQKFYNPKLYKPPAKRELSEEDRITVNMGGTLAPTAAPGGIAGTGITVLAQHTDAPPPPPEAFGAYAKKSEESGGVISMIDLLVKDLDKEMTTAKAEEKNAQEDYEKAMADSAAKRAQDSKSLTDKEGVKADLQSALEEQQSNKKSTEKELAATLKYIHSLHGECDWLVQYADVRKQARADELDSLVRAKAVLSGADYSLLQTRPGRAARVGGFLSAL